MCRAFRHGVVVTINAISGAVSVDSEEKKKEEEGKGKKGKGESGLGGRYGRGAF